MCHTQVTTHTGICLHHRWTPPDAESWQWSALLKAYLYALFFRWNLYSSCAVTCLIRIRTMSAWLSVHSTVPGVGLVECLICWDNSCYLLPSTQCSFSQMVCFRGSAERKTMGNQLVEVHQFWYSNDCVQCRVVCVNSWSVLVMLLLVVRRRWRMSRIHLCRRKSTFCLISDGIAEHPLWDASLTALVVHIEYQ